MESRPRNHHSTEIWRAPSGAAWLYVLGGFDGMSTTYANVDRAMLAEDGSLGAFASMTALPRALGGHVSAIVSNDGGAGGGASWMVVAGGMAGSATLDGSYVAPLNDDGSLGGWKAGPKLPHARMHAGAFVFGSFVYVLGGFENESVWDDVLRASVQPNGELSTFENVGKLPGPRSHFAVTRVGRSVYLTGGLAKPAFDNPPALTEVRRARLADDGSLTDFEALAPLPFAYATHSSFAYGGWLYVVGGVGEEAQEKRVLRAEILPDQTLGPWEAAAPLPLARGHVHQTPVYGDHVYSVGGAIDFELTSTKEIVIGSFRQP